MAPKTKERNSCCGYGAPARYADAKSQPLGLVSWDIGKLGPGWRSIHGTTWHHRTQVGSSFNLSSPSTFTSCQLNPEATRKCGLGSLGRESTASTTNCKFTIINFHVCGTVGRHIYESDSPQICHVQRQHTSIQCETFWNAGTVQARSSGLSKAARPTGDQLMDKSWATWATWPTWDNSGCEDLVRPGMTWWMWPVAIVAWPARWYCCVMMCNVV